MRNHVKPTDKLYAEAKISGGIETSSIPKFTHASPRIAALSLALGDLVALEISLCLTLLTRKFFMSVWPGTIPEETCKSLAFVFLFFPLGYALAGLYPGFGLGAAERLRRKLYVTFLLFIILIAWEVAHFQEEWLWRDIMLLSLGYAAILVPLSTTLIRETLMRAGLWGVPVVILGAGKAGALVVRSLRQDPSLGLLPVAFLDDDSAKWGQEVEGIKVVGPIELASKYQTLGVEYAILAMPGLERNKLLQIMNSLPFPHVVVIPNLFGIQSLWIATRDFGGVLGLEVKNNLLCKRNWILKRTIDYLLGIPLAIVCTPFILLFALLVKLKSPGPAFYVQEREGYQGRHIRILKLRTMYLDAEKRLEQLLIQDSEARNEWESSFKLKKDPRIIPGIGHFLRKLSLDELPQIYNVIRGEMSLIGPRPFPKYHLERFTEEFRNLRRSVYPGITGFWQVMARSDSDLQVQEALDTYYIRNWSIWLDLYILLKTPLAVLKGKGAY